MAIMKSLQINVQYHYWRPFQKFAIKLFSNNQSGNRKNHSIMTLNVAFTDTFSAHRSKADDNGFLNKILGLGVSPGVQK